MDSEDMLFILHTSGTTGRPKGLVHTHGGYSVYTATTLRMMFDIKEEDRWWCAADPGWITGHSYIVYGPLINGATIVMYEGAPNRHDLSSLRLLGSVGEPINPEAWRWYHRVIGRDQCPIMDTWRQTETSGFMITPLPITPLKPGSATKPFFGNEMAMVE